MGSGQTSSSMVMAVILHELARRKRAQVESYLQVFQEVVEGGGGKQRMEVEGRTEIFSKH